MDRLANMLAFVTVAETGSFSDAASRLSLANSVVSKRIKDLEDYLGAVLIQRTTRAFALTDAGHAYAAHARKLIDDLAEVEEHLRHRNENPVGDIKISAPQSFGNKFLGPALASFLSQYPDVTVTLNVHDRTVDLAREEFDLAICIGAGSAPYIGAGGMVVRQLAQSRRVVVASNDYLSRHGRPQTPADLARHDCLRDSGLYDGASWLFRTDGKERHQRVGGRFVTDSSALLCEAALRGAGIAALPTYLVGEYVVNGVLEILLEDFEPDPAAIHVVYPYSRRLRAKTRKLADHFVAHFAGQSALVSQAHSA